MFGEGLLKGLQITIKRFFKKKITELYPEVMPVLPARSHGSFDFIAQKCIACGLCVDACPNHVIEMETKKDEKGKKKVCSYKIKFEYCLVCGLCVSACPTAALLTSPKFELATPNRADLHFCWKGIESTESSNVTTENSGTV
jgi:NADH-quinone oxidoreductase subunit I